ncbi:MAG: M55 family metallopeptidase [Candidatus Asgardarchaeia archaeon]
MKAYISIDMEGIVGVVTVSQVVPKGSGYEIARRWMTLEAKSAITALHEMNVDDITIADSHGNMTNLLIDELPEYVKIISGYPRSLSMVNSISKDFDFAIFLGYHSRKGVRFSVMDHTYSSRTFQRIAVNDTEVSEFWLNAAIAGHFDVPIIFVSGDDKLVEHAKSLIPNIVGVVTKYSIGRRAAISKHPKVVFREIETAIKEAIIRLQNGDIKPFKPQGPFHAVLEVTDSTILDVVEFLPGVYRESGTKLRLDVDDIITLYRYMEVIALLGYAILNLP